MDNQPEGVTRNIVLENRAGSESGNMLSVVFTRGFAWCEVFVLLGLHLFWVLSSSGPLNVDNTWGGILALAPFAVILLLGAGSLNATICSALIRLEAPFHWMACLLQTVLLFHAVYQNPFHPMLPLSGPLYVWNVAMSFVLAADLSVHLRGRAAARKCAGGPATGRIALGAVVVWGVVMGLASGAAWLVFFWTASIVAHALMALFTLRQPWAEMSSAQPRRPLWMRALPAMEGFALLGMILSVQIHGLYCGIHTGNLAEKYPLFLDLFRAPAFFAGAGVLLLAARFRFRLLTHAALAVLLLVIPDGASWPLSLALGYLIPALMRATARQCGFSYALSCLIMTLGWILGLAGFAFSGLIVHFQQAGGMEKTLARGSTFFFVAFLALWGLGAILAGRAHKQRQEAETISSPRPAGIVLSTFVFCVVLLLAVVPAGLLVYKTAWPPRFLEQPANPVLDAPMAVCHAGYSESEEEYKLLDDLGVQALRADFHWSGTQPAPDQWNLAVKDGYVDAAVAHGKRVIAILDFDNNAVEQDPVGKTRCPYIAPADVPLFLEYVRRVVDRYKGRVYAWEIWNEPNMERFWAGSMAEFYSLAKQTAETVREVDASARIVGTAMACAAGVLMPAGIDGLHASGALAQVQHPSCHLYVTNPRHYAPEFAKVLGAAHRYNHPGPIWVTEVGSPDGGYYPWASDSALLADHVIKAYATATSLGIDLIVWYCFHDADAGDQAKFPIDSERFFGLLGPEGRWKPSAHAYRLFSHYCSHSVMRPDLVKMTGGLASRQLRTALYRRENGESALVLWFEPMLRPWGKARAHIEIGETEGPVIIHDIGSDYEKAVLDDTIEVTERPVFITFKAKDTARAVTIRLTGSPMDALWLIVAAGITVGSLLTSLSYLRVNHTKTH